MYKVFTIYHHDQAQQEYSLANKPFSIFVANPPDINLIIVLLPKLAPLHPPWVVHNVIPVHRQVQHISLAAKNRHRRQALLVRVAMHGEVGEVSLHIHCHRWHEG